MSGFKKFLLRGNLIDMAVAVVIGVAFNSMVQALITDLITPLITAFGSAPGSSFKSLTFKIGNSKPFAYGDFLSKVISFLVIASVVYFLLVAPAARLTALTARKQEATERPCPECLSTIPIAATRCKFCACQVPPYVPEQAASSSPTIVDRLRTTWPPHSK